jgi:hypothetical protein
MKRESESQRERGKGGGGERGGVGGTAAGGGGGGGGGESGASVLCRKSGQHSGRGKHIDTEQSTQRLMRWPYVCMCW